MVLWENIVIVRCILKYLGVRCHDVGNSVLNNVVKKGGCVSVCTGWGRSRVRVHVGLSLIHI